MRTYYLLGFLSLLMFFDIVRINNPQLIKRTTTIIHIEEEVCIEEIEIPEIEMTFDFTPVNTGNKVYFTTLNEFRENTEIEASAKEVSAYVKRFLPTALVEQSKFGIPASIKFAQGLLESNVGRSDLATKANNHFGIKDWSGKGMNMKDDSKKDMFRIYSRAWDSWRDHSKVLKGKRYTPLFKEQFNREEFNRYRNSIGRNYRANGSYYYGKDPDFDSKLKLLEENWNIPYKRFAYGLDILGYATSNRYANSLINLIEKNKLTNFDNLEVIF